MAVGQILACLLVLFRHRTFGHILDVQLFNHNQTEAVDQSSGSLVNEVMAAVANALMDTTNNLFGLVTCFASMLVLNFIEFSLHFGKCFLVLAKETWILDKLTIGESDELLQTNVHTDLFGVFRQ